LKKGRKSHTRFKESIVRTVAISVVCAVLEAHYVNLTYGDGIISPYHVLVFLIGVIAGFDRNLKIWIGNLLTYSVIEDAFYWVAKSQLPIQWSPDYIVIDHIPLYYIPYSIVAIILYLNGMKEEEN